MRMRRAILAFGLAALTATSGCQLVLGAGDYVVDEGTGGTGATATGAAGTAGTIGGGGSGGVMCTKGETKSCYSGPAGTEGVADCKAGTQTCNDEGTGFGPCDDEVLPADEIFHNDKDEDCNGVNDAQPLFSFLWGDAEDQNVLDLGSDAAGNTVAAIAFGGEVNFTGPMLAMGLRALTVVKFGPTGTPLWTAGNGSIGDTGTGKLAVSSKGEVAIAGLYDGGVFGLTQPMSPPDGYVIRLDPDGMLVWARQLDCPIAVQPRAPAFRETDVFLTGSLRCDPGFGPEAVQLVGADDVFVTNLTNPSGDATWSKGFGGMQGDESYASVALGPALMALSGRFFGTTNFGANMLASDMAPGEDLFLATVDALGNAVSAKSFGGHHYRQDLGADGSNNLLAAGWYTEMTNFGGSTLAGGAGSVFVAKLTATLDHVWSTSFGGPAFGATDGSPDGATISIATDSKSNVLLAMTGTGIIDFGGGALGAMNETSVFLVKLDKNGEHIWSKRIGPVDAADCYVAAGTNDEAVLACGVDAPMIDFGTGSLAGKGNRDVVLARFAP